MFNIVSDNGGHVPNPATNDSPSKQEENVEERFSAAVGDDGIWRDNAGEALHVSASDIERHAYCPLSWHLSRSGVTGVGHAVEEGVRKHQEIHKLMNYYNEAKTVAKRETTIWSWWFGIIIAYTIDAIGFFGIDILFTPLEFARYLVMLGLVWLIMGIIFTIIPWRRYFGMDQPVARGMDEEKRRLFKPLFDNSEFVGGWSEAGRVETSMFFAAMVSSLHGAALWRAEDREQAGYILLMVAMLWTLFASWRLQKVLIAETNVELSRQEAGLDEDSELIYSDDAETAELLEDANTGLRGRPDQIVIIDGELIPLEQKTGNVPRDPHLSHTLQLLAYLHLVEMNTGRSPPYGILRYGEDSIFQIDWDKNAKNQLLNNLIEIQRLMVEGGAKRNHERVGKCQNCSRKHACPEALA